MNAPVPITRFVPMQFQGSVRAVRYAIRDLATLDAAMTLTLGRSTVLQAGGCLGVFPKYLAAHFGAVYTFEPDPINFAHLCANVKEPHVIKMQAALGAIPGTTGIVYARRDRAPNRVVHEGVTHTDGEGNVPVLRIDAFSFKKLDLIVLDLEGFEFEALKGATRTINHHKPTVMLEINSMLEARGISRDDIHTHMRLLEYEHALTIHSDEIFVPARRLK